MKIENLQTFILHVPVTRGVIEDSTHKLTHWGAPGVIIRTENGLAGYGYTGTHAHLGLDRLIASCISETYGPLLIGEDFREGQHLWEKLFHFPPAQWVGRAGITHLALGAVDMALWDLRAKAAGLPLWKLLGGSPASSIEAYNTDGGWLNWPIDRLVEDARRLVEVDGYRAVKIKVGHADAGTDLEEPLWYDDVQGHQRLAQQIRTPIALGEQLYRLDDFRNFIGAGAVHFVQPDVARLAGITEWLQVADLALAHRLPVVPHIGDMAQVHLHLAIAHSACRMLEYIPWMRDCFEEPATVKEGHFVPPERPGVGTTLKTDALARYDVS